MSLLYIKEQVTHFQPKLNLEEERILNMKLQSLVLCLVLGFTLVLHCSEGKSTYISLKGHETQGANDESTVN